MVKQWFTGVDNYIKKEISDYKDLLKNLWGINNADKTGIPLAVNAGRVLPPTGARHLYQVVTSSKKQVTNKAGFNAFGEYLPNMILFSGEII
ncbi:hypothetical protein DPMN_017422 [Dreissena polymorpha]|uniref:Uncharacterized protein n=1 Tax=Dreissena polymorpha TaxID=45954 RepID=A0A9D4NFB2_DREPO|nr:hypothetical protein DPMN_017422 [Dreissena polymorpha]